jgi:hypothetical protein
MKRKHLTETPVCPQEHLVIISYTTGLSFALKNIGPLAAIIIIFFYLLILYLLALSNTLENPFASIYSESLILYGKYYDASPIIVGHRAFSAFLALVSVDLAALSAETLAAFASFRASVEAFNSASKAVM